MITKTLIATGLTGKEWLERLEKGGYKVSEYAQDIILSKEFNASRAKKGAELNIAIVPHREIFDSYETTQKIRDWGAEKGYVAPTPEVALLVREAFSNEEIEALGFWYIVTLHDPITDRDGGPRVLRARRHGGGRWLGACWDRPDGRWDAGGASVLSVPASIQSSETANSSDPLNLELRVEKLEKVIDGMREVLGV